MNKRVFARIGTIGLVLALVWMTSCATSSRQRNKVSPCVRSENYYNLAVEAFYHKEPIAAKKYLKKAEDLCPTNEHVYNMWGLIELGEGKYDAALAHFKKAVELDENYTDAIHNIAAVYIAQEDSKTALKYLKRAAKDTLYNYPYLVERNMGWCYYKLGDLERAKKHLKKAVFIEEYFCRAWYDLGMIAKQEGNLDLAEQYFKNAVRPNKRIPSKSCDKFLLAHYELAFLEEKLGKHAEAKKHFKTCIDLTEQTPNSEIGKECRRMFELLK